MRLQLLTWPVVEEYLQNSQAIIIPIGSTEQHGPMGLIGTDALTAEGVALELGKQQNVIVAPTISVGMALHHMEFPGSISLTPSTMIAYLVDYLASLAKHGFRKFFLINGHGGNIATIEAAFMEFYQQSEIRGCANEIDVQCKLSNWFLDPKVAELTKEFFGEHEGYHATPGEISMSWHLFPEAVKDVAFDQPDPDKNIVVYGGKDFRRRYPTGVMGAHSRMACPEKGKKIFELAVREIAADYQKFVRAS